MKRFVIIVLFFILYSLIFNQSVYASGEFSSSYQVNYDFDGAGVMDVTEKISLKNLTDTFYASNFSLLISATNITDLSAADNQGDLDVTQTPEGLKTRIVVKFKQQVVGKDKTLNFTLKFKSKDFSEGSSKVWQLTIPKIASATDLDSYDLNLLVPANLGDPAAIIPDPVNENVAKGRISFSFTKNQLLSSGVLAVFGESQVYKYHLTYNLFSQSILPTIVKFALPADTNHQQVIISNIEPRPDNVLVDEDGNYLAVYKLDRRSAVNVKVDGLARLFIKPTANSIAKLSADDEQKYTSANKYWEVDNPLIREKLSEIVKNSQTTNNAQKMALINQFVVDTLRYNSSRLVAGDYTRLGAVTALTNSDNALDSEFADLIVALARAAKIPARMLVGYASSANPTLKPLSFRKDVLHAWVEYYDPKLGWVMIDPAWQNTSGGVDYFSKFDLNHLVIATWGRSSTGPIPPVDIKAELFDGEFSPAEDLKLNLDVPKEIFAGFPTTIKIRLENKGNSTQAPFLLSINSGSLKLNLSGGDQIMVPAIPAFGFEEYSYLLRTDSIMSSQEDNIEVTGAGQHVYAKVIVKPFFAFAVFPYIIIALVSLLIGTYFGVLILHAKINKHGGSTHKKKLYTP